MTVRPVQGFLTSSGKYFDRESDAKAYDAAYFFHKRLYEFLSGKGAAGMFKDFMFDNVKDFILMHKDEIMDYMALTNDKPRPDVLDIRAPQLSNVVETGRTTTAPEESYQALEKDVQYTETGPVTKLEPEEVPMLFDMVEEPEDDEDGLDFIQGFDEGSLGPADG